MLDAHFGALRNPPWFASAPCAHGLADGIGRDRRRCLRAAAGPRRSGRLMQLVLRLAVCAALGWQAVMGGIALGHRTAVQQAVGYRARFLADTETRLRSALGADADLLFALRAAVPSGSLVITQKVTGRIEDIKSAADFERLNARNGLLVQLTTLLYPDPFLLAVSDPIAAVEDLVHHDREASLCVFRGDREPADRAGWSRTQQAAGFAIWHFRKD